MARLLIHGGNAQEKYTLEFLNQIKFKGYIHPRNLTWNLKMMVSKRNLLFQGLLFGFHVKFQGYITFGEHQ